MTRDQAGPDVFGEFPILVEVFDTKSGERLWKALVKGPGLLQMPDALSGRTVRLRLTYSVGTDRQRSTTVDDHTETAERKSA